MRHRLLSIINLLLLYIYNIAWITQIVHFNIASPSIYTCMHIYLVYTTLVHVSLEYKATSTENRAFCATVMNQFSTNLSPHLSLHWNYLTSWFFPYSGVPLASHISQLIHHRQHWDATLFTWYVMG